MPTVYSAAVSTRRLLIKRPWIYWVIVVAAAISLAVDVRDRLSVVDEAAAEWGTTASVLVAESEMRPGDALIASTRPFPVAMVPNAALSPSDVDALNGAIARQHIAAGEIVTDRDVAARNAPQSLIPVGWLAVPVFESLQSGATVGDWVQLVSDGFVVSERGQIVGHVDETTLIAVPESEAPLIAAAAQADAVTLILMP
jgi:hypothetical protein